MIANEFCVFQRICVQFPASTLGGKQVPVAPASGDPIILVYEGSFTCIHAHESTHTNYVKIK